ncbi:MAG: lanthionine synthetase LanC family protein [Gemmatimonadaceae bacterium]
MPEGARWLVAAEAIVHELTRTAHRFGGEATWMGTTQDEDLFSDELKFTYASLGPSLYGGTSGVALFLAEAAVLLNDSAARGLATESMRHALARAAHMPLDDRLGFYTGAVGVAWAAARAGRVLGDESLLVAARALLRPLPIERAAAPLDVIDGAAGTAPALLVLAEWCDAPFAREDALRLGERLLACATVRPDGTLSWGDPEAPDDSSPHLTGFAHGAAGIAWALLRLAEATGDLRYSDTALRAFAYENSLFRQAVGNWPDLRGVERVDDDAPCGTGWCHGGPGIGLARARALALRLHRADGPDVRRDTITALSVVQRALSAHDTDPLADASLCHGTLGLVATACTLGDALGDSRAGCSALRSAERAADRWTDEPWRWPVGVVRGENPSLMLGLAGIGHAYLRLADASLPSVLEPGG